MAHPPCIIAILYPSVSGGQPVRAAKQTSEHSWVAANPKPSARSTGLPGRRVAKQAALGKADAVDQAHPKTKLTRPDATRSRQFNFGRLTAVNANGADRISVISIIPTIVSSPNSSR